MVLHVYIAYISVWCCYITVDPETHAHQNGIWYFVHKKTNIGVNMTKTLHFDHFHIYIVEPFVEQDHYIANLLS
jgi:hypothetical protein